MSALSTEGMLFAQLGRSGGINRRNGD